MSDNIQKIIFPEQKYDIVVTSPNNVSYTPLNPVEVSHPASQTEQVCIVITDTNQPKHLTNTILPVQNMVSYSNAILPTNILYFGQEVAQTHTSSESTILTVAPNKGEFPNFGFLPTSVIPQPQIRNNSSGNPLATPPAKIFSNSSVSSAETAVENSPETLPNVNDASILGKRIRDMENLLKTSIKLNKKILQNQEDLKRQFGQFSKFSNPCQIGTERLCVQNPNESQPPLFRFSSQPETATLFPSVKSSPQSDSPPLFYEAQKEDANSPNLTIDLNYPIIVDGIGHRSPHHKYNSHSCSMYNKSIREFSDRETIAWLDRILPTLGPDVTMGKIQEVISQTNTITHFTAEFQKVVFTNTERKTLTTSGKFRKRKLERIVLGPLDTDKLQAIIQLSLYLFGVTVEDEERVKYQLKQAIDEKNRREFYREDRGTKRAHLSSTPY